jgi:hypothetical protein
MAGQEVSQLIPFLKRPLAFAPGVSSLHPENAYAAEWLRSFGRPLTHRARAA